MARIARLDDFKDKEKEDKSPRAGGNNLYTGGSQSGLNVIGRPDPKRDADDDDDISRILKQERTAEAGSEGELAIKYYKNGFVIGEDGDLRSYDDAPGKAFMAAIQQGRMPEELNAMLKGKDADVRMEDHRSEDYVPPFRAFKGAGATLGGAGGSASSAPASAVMRAGAGAGHATGDIVLDPAAPVVTVAVKLLNGKTEKVTLNPLHTVRDLQAKVLSFKGTDKAFVLVAGFPPKPLSDPGMTIAAAGLAGSAVTQRAA